MRTLERLLHVCGIPIVLLFFLLVLAPFVPGSRVLDHAMQTREAGLDAAHAQDRLAEIKGAHTDRLEDLIAIDPTLADRPGVTFIFGYTGDTHFTFTTSHMMACEPYILGK